MAPQRLSTFRGIRETQFGPGGLDKVDDQLLALAMRQVAAFSHVEVNRIRLLASLASGDFRVICDLVDAMRSSPVRDRVLESAARRRFSDDDFQIFKAVVAKASAVEKTRNDFAHGLFGCVPGRKDLLLVARPREFALQEAEQLVGERRDSTWDKWGDLVPRRRSSPPTDEGLELAASRDNIFVYTKRDLLRCIRDAQDATTALFSLTELTDDDARRPSYLSQDACRRNLAGILREYRQSQRLGSIRGRASDRRRPARPRGGART